MRPFFVTILAILLTVLVLFGSSDTVISVADTSVPDNELMSSEANNASATAGIRITMTRVVEE